MKHNIENTLFRGKPHLAARPLVAGLLLLIGLLAACGAPPSELPLVQVTPAGDAAVPQVVEPTVEIPPTLTPSPEPPTPTPPPTVPPTVAPTATPEGGVVAFEPPVVAIDPEATHPPLGAMDQPPYAESDCSDKYPCNEDFEAWEERIQLPEGYEATVYGRVEGQPNVITFGPDGLLYVGTMTGEIYTMDEDGNVELYVDGFIAPAGLAFQPGTDRLYVSSRVIDLSVGGEAEVAVVEDGVITPLITGLPCCYVAMHSSNGIAFGPDGFGYVAVGGRADHGEILTGDNFGQQDERHPYEASILRFSPDGTTVEPYARGFRNAYDIAWDADGVLFTTDNMPDFGPPEEFNRVEPGGEHGYPWFDCDVCFPAPDDVDIVPPLHTFLAHTSPTGIVAYLDDEFPGFYNSLFVTLWSAFPEAQRIVWFSPGGEEMADFATGFAAPIDLVVGPDGALYVADWATGHIFRIAYTGQ
jgi:glucose/arabinose dehydrogenase